MKKTIYGFFVLAAAAGTVSCDDWLRELPAGTQTLDEYYINGASCEPVVNGCYVPMTWELGGTYFNEWLIGDVCSDDAVKGGQNRNDHSAVLDMELFRVNADNPVLLDYYRSQYIGISRCNRALADIPKVPADEFMDATTKARLIAEAKFLRAFYHFRLARVFGKVPFVDFVITGSNQFTLQRAQLETLYAGIVKDLKEAEVFLWKKSEYPAADLGRATKGAAQALLMKVYLTGHEYLEDAYAQAEHWGEQIYLSQEYDLCDAYFDNFTLAGENGPESVFEIQYSHEVTSDYGGLGFTRGTFNVVLQRTRSQKMNNGQEGWGYNRPTQSLVDEYEPGDPRRDMTIYEMTADDMSNPQEDAYEGLIKTISLKYAMTTDGAGGGVYALPHATRGPINWKEIRYADVLLMYAEACVETGNTGMAKTLLEEVRARARGGDAGILPEFPAYNGYTDTPGDLREAIRHERRVELAMEGHRRFDLNRWGITHAAMTAFAGSEEIRALYPDISPFREGVHEIFPIPAEERRLAGLDQNPGY